MGTTAMKSVMSSDTNPRPEDFELSCAEIETRLGNLQARYDELAAEQKKKQRGKSLLSGLVSSTIGIVGGTAAAPRPARRRAYRLSARQPTPPAMPLQTWPVRKATPTRCARSARSSRWLNASFSSARSAPRRGVEPSRYGLEKDFLSFYILGAGSRSRNSKALLPFGDGEP